jgi:hypothetical protein
MNLGRGNVTLHASASGGPKIGSFLPQTFSIGGLILYLMPAADRRVGLLRQLRIAKPFGVLDLRRLDVQQTDVHRALLGLAGDRIGIRSSSGRRDENRGDEGCGKHSAVSFQPCAPMRQDAWLLGVALTGRSR